MQTGLTEVAYRMEKEENQHEKSERQGRSQMHNFTLSPYFARYPLLEICRPIPCPEAKV